MIVDPSNTPNLRLSPQQELKFTRPESDLYVGQILKTVVMKEISNNQVLININGENINAKTSHKLKVGENMAMKVLKTENGEIVLQRVSTSSPQSTIEIALAKELPKQAPATHLLASLNTLQQSEKLPTSVSQAIQNILNSFVSIPELSSKLALAIANSGIFFEANLLKSKDKEDKPGNDFKAKCLQLLECLQQEGAKKSNNLCKNNKELGFNLPIQQGLPNPLAKPYVAEDLEQLLPAHLLNLLAEQTEETLARIKTEQLLHLSKTNQMDFEFRLDLPLKTHNGFDVIPIYIKKEFTSIETDDSEKNWSLGLALNLEHLGEMQAKIKLANKAIYVELNIAETETLDLLKLNQAVFDSLLSSLNLHLHGFTLNIGLEEQQNSSTNLRLLDIKI